MDVDEFSLHGGVITLLYTILPREPHLSLQASCLRPFDSLGQRRRRELEQNVEILEINEMKFHSSNRYPFFFHHNCVACSAMYKESWERRFDYTDIELWV